MRDTYIFSECFISTPLPLDKCLKQPLRASCAEFYWLMYTAQLPQKYGAQPSTNNFITPLPELGSAVNEFMPLICRFQRLLYVGDFTIPRRIISGCFVFYVIFVEIA